MEFPTSAAYPLSSYDETSLLLDEMQRQSSEMEASRDEAEEGYEINMIGNNAFEVSATVTGCGRSRAAGRRSEKKQHSRGSSSRKTSYGKMEAPLSPHIDVNALSMDPPVGKEPEVEKYLTAGEEDGGTSIMDTLSDLADGVDFELDTVKGLLYKVKRERDTYKRSNHALQQSLSEAIAFKSDLEAEHRQALDVILCTANDEKRRLEDELKTANDSKRKLKKLVAEMIEEKNELESQLKENATRSTLSGDADARLEEERTRHFNALSEAINDLEAKFELDMKEVIKEKDEEMEAKMREHKQILQDAMESKDEEMKREKHSHSMIVKALEDDKQTLKEDLAETSQSLNQLKEEYAMKDDVHDMEIADLRKEFEGIKPLLVKQFKQKEIELQLKISQHSEAIDQLEAKLQVESMQSQALGTELATKKEEIAAKDAEIDAMEKKLLECNVTYTREYDRMKAHLTEMCNLVESSSADRDRARDEAKKLKAEHEKQNEAQKAEIEKLKRKFEDGAREMMAQLASSSSGESQDKNELSQSKSSGGFSINESEERSEKVLLLNRLETITKERDELSDQVQRFKAAAAEVSELPGCTSDEGSCMYLGDVDSGEPATSTTELDRDSFASKVHGLESNLKQKDEEIAALNSKLVLANKELQATLEERCHEVAALNEKFDLNHRELETALDEKNEKLTALEQQLKIASQENELAGTVEHDLCEYSMAKMDRALDNDSVAIMQECDQLKNEVQRLKILLEQAEVVRVENELKSVSSASKEAADALNAMAEELPHMKKLLAERDEEVSDYKIKMCMYERLERDYESLEATLNKNVGELAHLEETLAKQEEELSEYKGKVEMCESLERERDTLKAELTTMKATVETSNDESAAAKLGEELSSLKAEHRVEIKLLKKEHASTKTKYKLLKKELQKIGTKQREMIDAYDAERQSNAELSSSLEEMVTLLENEKIAHSNQVDNLRSKLDELKLQFSHLKKKRVPIDCAFKAARISLEAYEASWGAPVMGDNQSCIDNSSELKTVLSEKEAEIALLAKELQTVKSKAAELKDELQLKKASFEQVQALEGELNTVNSLLAEKMVEIEGLKDGLDELESQLEVHVQKDGETIQALEQQVSDERRLREATIEKMDRLNDVIDELKGKLADTESMSATTDAKHSDELKRSIEAQQKMKDELAAASTEIEALHVKLDRCEGEIASAQREQDQRVLESTEREDELKKTRDEMDVLNTKITEYQTHVAELQSECSQLKQANEVANCSQRDYETEAKRYVDEIELLKKQMAASEIKSKQVLKEEVDRLKSEFNEVITAFEKELVDTCESNANEVNKMLKELNEHKETISLLEIQISDLKSQNKDANSKLEEKVQVEVDLAKARKQLIEAEAKEKSLAKLQEDHSSLVESFEEIKAINLDMAKTLEETESSKKELKTKLHETLLSVDNNLKEYKNLSADHDSLQKECDLLKSDSASLHELVSSLTSEKEKLMNDIDSINGTQASLEQEVEKYKNHQLSLEQLIATLRDELNHNKDSIESLQKDNTSKQQQIDALQEQSTIANGHLDEMVTYCDKLKTDFAGTSASLRKEIDDQAESMKDVINALKNQLLATETEKEENRKMYESDIELQQSEVETLKKKNAEALSDLDSLSDLVSGLKEKLEEEKSNNQVLRSQFKESESDRKAVMARNSELQDELASKYESETIMRDRIRSIEMEMADLRPMPDKLTEMMKTESVMRERIHALESQLNDLSEVERKLVNAQNIETTMRDRIHALENQSKNFQMEYKNAIKRKEEEGSKLRVVLQECREKLHRLMQENERLKHDNVESSGNLKAMLNEAIRSRADTEAALQESLQLLEQQKRVDIKRKGELSKLEQTVEILKSKERYLESYVASLKNQLNRG